jgi:hypothetical protein
MDDFLNVTDKPPASVTLSTSRPTVPCRRGKEYYLLQLGDVPESMEEGS